MHARLTLAALATLIGLGGAAHAEIFGSAMAYNGNPTNTTITCRIFNYGLANVSVTLSQIWTSANSTLTLNSNSCNIALVPGHSCAFTAVTPGNFAHACRIATSGADEKVSGVVELFNTSGAFLSLPFGK